MNKAGALPVVCALLVLLVLPAATAGAPSVETVPASGTYVLNDDRVNVRDAPDVQSGKIVAQLNRGAVVDVVGMTRLAYEVSGHIAAWFRLVKPEGWIFGWYLDPIE
jgi:hypothetical protein